MKNLFILTAIAAFSVFLHGCGHSAGHLERYAETIFWEDTEADPAYAQTEELSDSQLIAEEITEEEELNNDTVSSTEPAGNMEIPVATQPEASAPVARGKGRLPLRQIGRLHEVFNDSNHYQLEHARRLGVEPMTHMSSYYNTRRPLVKIETNKDFVVDELRHSYPYLVPEAAKLLHDIGRNFQDSLASRNGGKYRIIVTSVLRTPVTVRKLRRVNGNATQESTHQFGTTFDITYTRFNPAEGQDINSQEDLKNLLGEVLYDLHRQGRCMVKYERKSPCFHITVAE